MTQPREYFPIRDFSKPLGGSAFAMEQARLAGIDPAMMADFRPIAERIPQMDEMDPPEGPETLTPVSMGAAHGRWTGAHPSQVDQGASGAVLISLGQPELPYDASEHVAALHEALAEDDAA